MTHRSGRLLALLAGLATFFFVLVLAAGLTFAAFGEISFGGAAPLALSAWLAGFAADRAGKAVAADGLRGVLAVGAAFILGALVLGEIASGQTKGQILARWLSAASLAAGGLVALIQARRHRSTERPPSSYISGGTPPCGGVLSRVPTLPVEAKALSVPAMDLPKEADDPIVLRPPTQCVLWGRPDLMTNEATWVWPQTSLTGTQDVHGGTVQRTQRTCAECGQLYFVEKLSLPKENWLTCIPVDSPATSRVMAELPVWDIVRYSPRLQHDGSNAPAWARPHLTEDGRLERPAHGPRPIGITEGELANLHDPARIKARLEIAIYIRRGYDPRHLSLASRGDVSLDFEKIESDSATETFSRPAAPTVSYLDYGRPVLSDEPRWILLEAPTRCRIWTEPQIVENEETWAHTETLSDDESPVGNTYRSLKTCRECGRLYLYQNHYYKNEWTSRAYIPVDTRQRAEFIAGLYVDQVMRYIPCVSWNGEGAPRWVLPPID